MTLIDVLASFYLEKKMKSTPLNLGINCSFGNNNKKENKNRKKGDIYKPTRNIQSWKFPQKSQPRIEMHQTLICA